MAKYPYFGVPPDRKPRPVTTEPALMGKRVILSTPDGFVYDMRAASELRTDGAGNLSLQILTEEHYYDHILNSVRHEPIEWPAHLVWVEG